MTPGSKKMPDKKDPRATGRSFPIFLPPIFLPEKSHRSPVFVPLFVFCGPRPSRSVNIVLPPIFLPESTHGSQVGPTDVAPCAACLGCSLPHVGRAGEGGRCKSRKTQGVGRLPNVGIGTSVSPLPPAGEVAVSAAGEGTT